MFYCLIYPSRLLTFTLFKCQRSASVSVCVLSRFFFSSTATQPEPDLRHLASISGLCDSSGQVWPVLSSSANGGCQLVTILILLPSFQCFFRGSVYENQVRPAFKMPRERQPWEVGFFEKLNTRIMATWEKADSFV